MAEDFKEKSEAFFLTSSIEPNYLKPLSTYQPMNGVDDRQIDYLQDPSLWRDHLPQPYRLVNDIAEEVLEHIFLLIQERESEKDYQNKHKKKIPLSDEGTLMSCLHGATRLEHVHLKERGLLFAGGGHVGIVCIDLNINKHFSSPLEGSVNSISAQALSRGTEEEIVLLAVGMGKHGGVIFIFNQDNTFHKICELEGIDVIQNVLLSKRGTYLAVTGLSDSEGKETCQVSLYSLPIDSWLQQLQTDQDSFNKPNFLFNILSPSPLTPSQASDPSQAIKLIGGRSSLPTGSNHGLTKTYLQTRRNKFVSKRKDFISIDNEDLNYTMDRNRGGQTSADVHFIHYWKREYHSSPKILAIQWDNTSQLHLYVILEKNKITTLSIPDQVYLQPSLITCTVISENTSYLAIGNSDGILSLTDLSTNILWGVVDLRSPLTSICFVQCNPPTESIVIVGGCENGTVTCVKWNEPGIPTVKCLTKGYDVPRPVRELRCNTCLPPTVISLHSDRSLIIWDWLARIPLVTLPLPSSYCLLTNPKGTLVTGPDVVALIAKTSNEYTVEQLDVFSWQLSTCEGLRKTCLMKDDLQLQYYSSNSCSSDKEQLNVCDELTKMITSMNTVQLTV